MNLKELARSYEAFGGAVRFYMLPYRTIMIDVIANALHQIKPISEWSEIEHLWPYTEALTVDIEFADELPSELQGLRAYWQGRNGSTAGNFLCFQQVVNKGVYAEWANAYTHTRDGLIAADPDLEQPEPGSDPNALAATSKPKKPSKLAGGKRQKPNGNVAPNP